MNNFGYSLRSNNKMSVSEAHPKLFTIHYSLLVKKAPERVLFLFGCCGVYCYLSALV